jgi:hypothetical protein
MRFLFFLLMCRPLMSATWKNTEALPNISRYQIHSRVIFTELPNTPLIGMEGEFQSHETFPTPCSLGLEHIQELL